MKKEEINIFFAGDIFIGQSHGLPISDRLKRLICCSEIASCNFEGPTELLGARPIQKAGPNIMQSLRAPDIILENKFNLINLGNNHIMDYRWEALEKTLSSFKKVICVGAGRNFEEAYGLKKINLQGVKIGFLSFSEWGAGVIEGTYGAGFAWINHQKTNKIIQDSRKFVDILIIQVHAGEEDLKIPQPEWRKRYRELIDLGADLIIGHHPHVPQPLEIYKGKHIFYSLGNFFFDSKEFSNSKGYVVTTKINIHKKKISKNSLRLISFSKGSLDIHQERTLSHFVSNYFREKTYSQYINEYLSLSKKRYEEVYKMHFTEKRSIRFLKNLIRRVLFIKVYSKEIGDLTLRKRESHRYIIHAANKTKANFSLSI